MSDHGFDFPVVYELNTLEIKNQRMPMMFNHRTEVGHTTKVNKTDTQLDGFGLLSVDNKASKRIINAAANDFPYQASMGLDVRKANITFHPQGLRANNRQFNGPHYLMSNAVNDEMTITPMGRDSNTSVQILNSKMTKQELTRIKNAAVTPKKNATKEPPQKKKSSDGGKPVKNAPTKGAPSKTRVKNKKPATPVVKKVNNSSEMAKILRLVDRYPEQKKAIYNALDRGMPLGRIANMAKIKHMESQLPKPARVKNANSKGPDFLEARLLNALCKEPEKTLERRYGKEVRDQVMDMPQIGLKEFLVLGAQRCGQNFTGHSDVERLCNWHTANNRARMLNLEANRINNLGFSSFDMPLIMQRVTQFTMEEAWRIEDFFAPSQCYATSNNDFKTTKRYRPSGGTMWDGLDAEGKIKHGTSGEFQSYETTLDTKAQMLVFNREIIENDDLGAIDEMLQLMIEGALIIPDYKLLQHMLQANSSTGFFRSSGDYINDYSGANASLNVDNLKTIYAAAQKQTISKGRVNWVNRLGDIWQLVIPPELEITAWEILNQPTLIGPTGSRQGSKNFWAGKMEVVKFNQLSNTSMNGAAQSDMWFLWPKGTKYAPWAITYLRGKKSPTVEVKEVPADMLGFAVRGYFDVEINDREPTAVIRARPTGSL